MAYKLLRVRLENYLQLLEGCGQRVVELDFTEALNKGLNKYMLLGRNGSGKSELLSALTPFSESFNGRPHVIVPGENGSKEIDYIDEDNTVVRCSHLWSKSGTVRSFIYIKKADEEEFTMLPSTSKGLVTVFRDEVKNIFNIDSDFITVSRIGTTISSFIDLKPAERKKYLSRFINDIDEWILANKNAASHLAEFKREIRGLQVEIERLPKADQAEHELAKINKSIEQFKTNLSQASIDLGSAQASLTQVEEVITQSFSKVKAHSDVRKLDEYDLPSATLYSLDKALSAGIQSASTSISEMHASMPKLAEFPTSAEAQEKLNSFVLRESNIVTEQQGFAQIKGMSSKKLHELTANIRNIETQISRIQNAPNELAKLQIQVEPLQEQVNIAQTEYAKYSAVEINDNVTFEDISQTADNIFRLRDEISPVLAALSSDETIKICEDSNYDSLAIKNIARTHTERSKQLRSDVNGLTKRVATASAQDTYARQMSQHKCSSPNCPHEAALKRFSEAGSDIQKYEREITYKSDQAEHADTLAAQLNEAASAVSSLSSIFNTFVRSRKVLEMVGADAWIASKSKFLELLKKPFSEIETILDVRKYLAALNSRRALSDAENRLQRITSQITTLQESVKYLDDFNAQLESYKVSQAEAQAEFDDIEAKFEASEKTLATLTKVIATFTTYAGMLKKHEVFTAAAEVVSAAVAENSDAITKQSELETSVNTQRSSIEFSEAELSRLEEEAQVINYKLSRLAEFDARMQELQDKASKAQLIVDVTSPTKGAPVNFIKAFIDKIRFIVNDLLDPVVNKTLSLDFELNEKEFNIPVHRSSGRVIPDASMCSEGQRSVIKTILSMALVKNLYSSNGALLYPIIGLDEIDGPLDHETYRRKFVQVIDRLCREINIQQVFMISHNDEFYAEELGLILLPGHAMPIEQENFVHNKTIVADFS